MMNKIKYMIWDFDGTLVDTYPVMTKSLLRAIGDLGIKSDYDEVYRQLKVSLSEAIEHFAEGDEEISSQIRRKFEVYEHEEDPSAYGLFPDTIKTLAELKNIGITHFVLTHRNSSTYRIMKAKGMEKYITDVIISDDGFKRKPDPEAFDHLIEKHCLPKEETLSIGDRMFDVQAGKNAGIKGCLIMDQYNLHLRYEVDHAVDSRWDIAELILNNKQ